MRSYNRKIRILIKYINNFSELNMFFAKDKVLLYNKRKIKKYKTS